LGAGEEEPDEGLPDDQELEESSEDSGVMKGPGEKYDSEDNPSISIPLENGSPFAILGEEE